MQEADHPFCVHLRPSADAMAEKTLAVYEQYLRQELCSF